MIFLSVLLVLALVQWWGSGAPLQKDGGVFRYWQWLDRRRTAQWPTAQLLMAVLLPALLVWLLTAWVVTALSPILGFFIAVPVLLYSLGRGEFSLEIRAYIDACERGDSVAAAEHLARLQGIENDDGDPEDWPELHRQAIKAIAYHGFERMFAVIFWFVLLGPAGALLYRLSALYRARTGAGPAERWLWLLEWPAVRLMGLSWAMAGDFDRCYSTSQKGWLDTRRGASAILTDQMTGALGCPDLSRHEAALSAVRATQPLFTRALWLWVCVLALVTLLA